MPVEIMLLTLVIIAGLYMAWNIGANDVANAMGTSVGSGALSLRQAVILAAILEFSGAFFFGSHVTETLNGGLVDSSIFQMDPMILVYGMLSALLAAGIWIQLASYKGWPVATTHCIVGSIVGFGTVVGGWEAVFWDNVLYIASSWILSPIIAGIISFSIFNFLRRKIFFSPDPLEATKRLTPPLVFIVLTTLSLVMLCNGLKIDKEMNFMQSLAVSMLLGAIASFISYICLSGSNHFGSKQHALVAAGIGVQQALEPVTVEPYALTRTAPSKSWIKAEEEYHPEISSQLEKAKKHLQHVHLLSKGDAQYKVSEWLTEIENFSQSLRKTEESGKVSEEYARVERVFGYLQIISACFMAFAHGANDVANAIGPLTAAIGVLTTGAIATQSIVPTWALGVGGLGIVFGLATWGWRVIETIGKKITELTPTRGFAAEFGAAATILIASRFGLPVSTTHTLVGSVIGVGMARGIEALDLGTMRPIVLSWLMTVPAGAGITIGLFYLIKGIFG